MILLDLFCGRWGWSRAFAKRGWECYGFDLSNDPFEHRPENCHFIRADVMDMRIVGREIGYKWNCEPFLQAAENFMPMPDAIVASSPCEEFSVHGMKHFHPHPKYPKNGIRLFEHTRQLCEAAGVPYVMENVRSAQQFVGTAKHHCGPFYLWGNAVPPILNQGIKKMIRANGSEWVKFRHLPPEERKRARNESNSQWPTVKKEAAQEIAQIPPELANTVADYMERLIELMDSRGVRPGYASLSEERVFSGLIARPDVAGKGLHEPPRA